MMKYRLKLLFVFVVFQTSISCAQITAVRMFDYRQDGVSFQVTVKDSIYSYNDFFDVKLVVRNDNNSSILIFAPESGLDWGNTECSYDLGNNYFVRLGSMGPNVVVVKSKSSYSTSIRLKFLEIGNEPIIGIQDNEWVPFDRPTAKHRRTFIFNGVFFKETDKIKYQLMPIDSTINEIKFDSDTDALLFEEHLVRFNVGSCRVFLK